MIDSSSETFSSPHIFQMNSHPVYVSISFIHSFIHLFIHKFIHSFIHSIYQSINHLLIHTFIYLFVHLIAGYRDMETSWFMNYGCKLRMRGSKRQLLLFLLVLSTFVLLLQSIYLHGNVVSGLISQLRHRLLLLSDTFDSRTFCYKIKTSLFPDLVYCSVKML